MSTRSSRQAPAPKAKAKARSKARPPPTSTEALTHRRLMRDIAELAQGEEDGIAAYIDDSDVTGMCLHLTPSQGDLHGLRLHFAVCIPAETWPIDPPIISASTLIEHPNVFANPGAGGHRICVDILRKETEMAHLRTDGYDGGYTSAYDLPGIFRQISSFFSDIRVEQTHGYINDLERREAVRNLFSDDFEDDDDDDLLFTNNGPIDVPPPYIPLQRYIPGLDARPSAPPQPPASVPRRYLLSLRSALAFSCHKCGYGRSIPVTLPGAYSEPGPLPTAGCGSREAAAPRVSEGSKLRDRHPEPASSSKERGFPLEKLPDDIWFEILARLSTSEILILSKAWQPISALVASANLIAKREVRCFCLKKPAAETILGIGVGWNQSRKSLTSSFDYVSLEAFETLGVRRGVRRDDFSWWLPLAINATHFERAKPELFTRLAELERVLINAPGRNKKYAKSPLSFMVLATLANDIVVRLMESCGDSYRTTTANKETILFASERAIGDYLSICHLLASIAASSPEVKAAVDQKLLAFIDDPPKRLKRFTPNLGELLVLLAATENVHAMDLVRPLLREALTRSVVWSLDPVQGRGLGGLALLEKDRVCEWRLASTFEAQKTSLRLLCYQFTFYRKVAALRQEGRLDVGLNARYGLAPPGLATELVQSIRSIFALDNFASFSKFLELPPISKPWMTAYLRQCVLDSEAAGYHSMKRTTPEILARLRARDDPAWRAAHPHVRPATQPGPEFFIRPSQGDSRPPSRRSPR